MTEMVDIAVISNETAVNFLKANKAAKECVFYRPCDKWYGAFAQGCLRGVGGQKVKSNKKVTIGGVFVADDWREMGIGTLINDAIINENSTSVIVAYARPVESHILSKRGFVVKQTYKNGTVKMERKAYNE